MVNDNLSASIVTENPKGKVTQSPPGSLACSEGNPYNTGISRPY